MILFNGCSFSTPTGLEEKFENLIWPNMLAKRLKQSLVNLSQQGKSNTLIYRELYTYLIWCKQKKLPMPSHVIMQSTDFFRDHIFNALKSGTFKPNNFESQLFKPLKNYIKIAAHSHYDHFLRNKKDVRKISKIERKSKVGNIIHIERGYLMDMTFREQQLRHLLEINSLQKLCNEMNIEFTLLNFQGYDNTIQKDPLFKEFDKSSYVLANLKNNFYNYMIAIGFELTDTMHFNIDGHKFISDTVYKKIKFNKKFNFTALPSNADRTQPIFDYT